MQVCRRHELHSFASDTKTVYAVLRAVEIIGEASKNIPAAVKTKYSEIPWKDIAGMRDKVIHVYFGVDLKRVWRTVTEDIPNLRSNFEKILKDNKS